MKQWLLASALAAVPLASGSAQQVPANSTTVLAPLVGQRATPAAGQSAIGMYAADLGLTAVHQGELRIVFGDGLANSAGAPLHVLRDDPQGRFSLASFPDGDAVDAYVAAHPPAPGELTWQSEAPPVIYRVNPFNQVSPMLLSRGGPTGPVLNTAAFKAPIAAFGNAKAGAASGFFTIYHRSVAMQCSGGFAPSCSDGLQCDQRLGKLGGDLFEDGTPCVLGTPFCFPVIGRGLCVDPSSSVYDPNTNAGLVRGVALRHEVGNADPLLHERYYTRSWFTNKFGNLSARTVNDFNPARVNGVGNDYRAPDGMNTGAERVFMWGRPGYAGTKLNGGDAQLYFAYVDMPSYSASASFAWVPRYFSGLSTGGVPQFTTDQKLARPLPLGGSPTAETETWDVVNQMSVSWVAALGKWVMIYGGGLNPALADFFTAGQGALVQHDPEGAMHARFASHPWGPWSAPQQLFKAGNPNPLNQPPAAGSQYAPGGILRHPLCAGSNCAPHEPSSLDPNDFGFLYGPNVVDAWTEAGDTAVTLYWNVSTWDPYQVVLLKSRIPR